MLETLRIVNLGAVDALDLDLEPGLTVLTGETGVGKTLLIEALHLVLGGNDRGVPVRVPSEPSRVEAVFSTVEGDELVLARERTSNGRLRALVDGGLSSAQVLSERAEPLCELHGQHEHQVLRAPGSARALLDRAFEIDDAEVRERRAQRRALEATRARLGGSEAERARRLELLQHEADEIDGVAPDGVDEVERLQAEAAAVSSILESKDALHGAARALDGDGDEASAAGLLVAALALVPRTLAAPRAQLTGLLEQARALSGELRHELEALEEDPERLDALNARIARLQALVRKHGAVLADVLARREALDAELVQLRADEARSKDLDDELARLARTLADAESAIRAERERAAVELGAAVTRRLPLLALPHARFEVLVEGDAGEQVQFLFAGTGAFEPAPLADTASGGELSRVMLALTLATRGDAGCVVFDEVDAGVGGKTARSLAACLAELAADRQVIVVTHLATVAAIAAHHLVVARAAGADGPAEVAVVRDSARVEEIARMLAGDPTDPVAIAHAEALLTEASAAG
ncbi:MAG TPA: AAA family ATPase [Acidimicrobiales bacterium]|jgi:DNA repair protein RecN (Recombination protein N)|nr:AAA family ATPase [Acidimicrobiales bacterium]